MRKNIYAVYDTHDNEQVRIIGNISEVSAWLERTVGNVYRQMWRNSIVSRRYEVVKLDE